MLKRQIVALFLSTLCLGCNQAMVEPVAVEESSEGPTGSGPSGIASSITAQLPGNNAQTSIEEPASAETAPELNAPERVKAQVGVAKQGRSLDNETGVGAIIAQPARSLFAFKEKAVFDIQIPSALKLFQATEGRAPKSNDEYMNKIIKANSIQLPTLPAGQTYEYDPQRGELMVLRPKN